MAIIDRIARICDRDLGERPLRIAVLAELRGVVPFDAYAWLLTDPETCVGSSPLAETPSLADLPALIRLKYLTPINRWTSLPADAAVTLIEATGGELARSRLWAELLSSYGVADVLSTVFRDQYGCWAFLDLWRGSGSFTAAERSLLGSLGPIVTPALRRRLATTFTMGSPPAAERSEPLVLLLSDALQPLTRTPQTDGHLRALLPPESGREPVPAAAFNVAAQLLAREAAIDTHPPWARVHVADGRWVTVRAASMDGTAPDTGRVIAVSIEPTPPAERTALYARVIGLSGRETELLRLLVGGSDTRQLARSLHLSEHTVQDHLKAVFAKAGANNRRVLVARATGAA